METFVGCEPSVVNNPRLGVDGHRAVRSGTCGSSTVPSKPNFTDRSAPRVNRLDLFFGGAHAMSWSIAHTFTTNNVEKLVCSVHPTEDPKRTSSRTLLEKGIKLARAMAA